MGPLGKLWLDFDNIRKGNSDDSLDIYDCLDTVEKSITLLGQAFITTIYHRRMNSLYNLTKDLKRAKQLLKKNNKKLSKRKNLFGKRFYKSLSKEAKVSKKSKEISRQLGSNSSKGKSHRYRSDRDRNDRKRFRQPFRSEATRQNAGRGGRVKFSRGRGTAHQSNRGKRITFTFSKPNIADRQCERKLCAGGVDSGNRYTFIASRSKGPRSQSYGGRKSPNRGETEILSAKLAETDTRQFHSSGGSGTANTLHNTSSTELPASSKYINKDFNFDKYRGSGYVSQRCNKTSATLQRSISEPCILSAQEGWGNRPVINLKKLNQNIEYQHFKMEGIQSLKSLIQKEDFMVKIDLSEAYFSLPGHTTSRKFLRFLWKGKIYEYVALPFGLAVGPRYFTKTMKPIIAFLRRMGVRIVI